MRRPILLDQGGHVDDLLSTLLLWLSPEVELQAVGVTNAGCYADLAYETTLKMATYLNLEGPEIAVSNEEVPNPFPINWRDDSVVINDLPLFEDIALKRRYQTERPRRSDIVFSDCLKASRVPVTIVATAPLTNLARVFRQDPTLEEKVKEIFIMGGALKVEGNVELDETDGSAEWNTYADPYSFKAILNTKIPIKLHTLDLTNNLPVTEDFLKRLEEQSVKSKASKLASRLWQLVSGKGFQYYFWDTSTAAAIIEPSLFKYKTVKIDVTTDGVSRGKISTSLFGHKIQLASSVEKSSVENLILSIFSMV